MAAQPPPYSPEELRRAQRERERAWRYYWASLRRPSLVGPLVLIGIGVAALLVELGRVSAPTLWDWYLRWWPLLLITIGLISLCEWGLNRRRPYAGRPHYGGVLLLLFLLLLVAIGERDWRRGLWSGWNGHNWILQLSGVRHQGSYETSRALGAGTMVQIQAPRGNVTVEPSGDNQLYVQEEATVYAANDDDASKAIEALHPQLVIGGKNAVVSTNGHIDGRADLTLRVPLSAAVSIVSGAGDVLVEDLTTPVDVTSRRGSVTLLRLKGPARARMGRGDFTAQSVGADLSVQGHMNNVAISGVGGDTLLEGPVFGDLRVAQAGAQVRVETGRTQVVAAALPGSLSLGARDLRVEGATGPLNISTRAKDILCSGIAGDVNIENRNGEIAVSLNGQPGATRIENQNGAIRLTLPPAARFTLQATAKTGDVSSPFGLPVEKDGRGHTASGPVGGGGAMIDLVAEHGDIRIEKGDTAADSGAPADSGTATAPGARRLRAPRGATPVIQTQ